MNDKLKSTQELIAADKISSSNILKRLIRCIWVENLYGSSSLHIVKSNGNVIPINHESVSEIQQSDFLELIQLLVIKGDERVYISDPFELLNVIKDEIAKKFGEGFKEKNWLDYFKEINNCHINDTLNIDFRRKWNKKLLDEVKQSGFPSLWDYKINKLSQEELILFFEQWSAVGHSIVPGFKTKLHFSSDDNLLYSPEFQPKVDILLAALHKDLFYVQANSDNFDYMSWFSKLFPNLVKKWKEKLENSGYSPNNFLPIPIHPWQEKNVISKNLNNLIKSKKLIILPDLSFPGNPTLSLRTMIPDKENNLKELLPHIKLTLSTQVTSVSRHITASQGLNSTKVSNLIKDILQKESRFDNTLNFVDETCYITIKGDNDLPYSDSIYLAAVYRNNVVNYIKDDEIALPLAALFVHSPVTNQPLLAEIVRSSLQQADPNSVIDYFKNYCSIALNGPLGMYLKYGVSLESHEQNVLPVFQDGRLKRIIVRDSMGVKIHSPSLRTKGYKTEDFVTTIQFFEDRYASNHIIYCLFHSHLNRVASCLSIAFNIDFKILLKVLKEEVIKVFDKYKDDMSCDEWNEERSKVLEDKWYFKAFIQSKLDSNYKNRGRRLYATCENPLKSIYSE